MNDDRLERLLWEMLDGEIPPDDERLANLVREHPDAERLRRQVAELASILRTVPPVEPEADLEERVRHAVARREVPPRVAEVGGRRGWPRWAERCAAMAAGLLLGVLVYHLFLLGRPPASPARFSGSVATVQPLAVSHALQVPLGEVGELAVLRAGTVVVLEAALKPDHTARIELVPAEGELSLIGLAARDASKWLVEQGRRVVVEAESGGRYRLELRVAEKAWPLRLRVSTGGEVVVERELRREAVPQLSSGGANSATPRM